ncbi:hypothetical protein UlMin_022701 [Ulmus minor]
MGETNEERSRVIEKNLALQIEKYPRDLLQRLVCSSNTQQLNQEAIEEEDSDEVELNLGLLLGASPIFGTMPLVRDDEATALPPILYSNLIRTSLLLVETEEEWKKRKESEKQRNSVKVDKEGCSMEEERRDFDGQLGINLRDKQLSASPNKAVPPPFGVLAGVAAARQVLLGSGVDLMAKGKSGFVKFGQPTSQGSVESHGGSSYGMSELESKPLQVKKNSSSFLFFFCFNFVFYFFYFSSFLSFFFSFFFSLFFFSFIFFFVFRYFFFILYFASQVPELFQYQ